MNTKKQGDIGVAAAILYYTKKGYTVSVPLGDSARYDLVVDKGNEVYRVQVKTTNYTSPHGVPILNLRTSGGNQSGAGISKLISASETDLVFGYCLVDDTMYEFPVEVVAGKVAVHLSSKKDQYTVL